MATEPIHFAVGFKHGHVTACGLYAAIEACGSRGSPLTAAAERLEYVDCPVCLATPGLRRLLRLRKGDSSPLHKPSRASTMRPFGSPPRKLTALGELAKQVEATLAEPGCDATRLRLALSVLVQACKEAP